MMTVSTAAALLGAFLASAAPAAAAATAGTDSGPSRSDPAAAGPVRLAQAGVEVFFDGAGNRVLLDARTGRVIAIERLGPAPRLRDSGVLTARPGAGDPAALERYRRFREYQLGLREPPGQGVFPGEEAFPEAPAAVEPRRNAAPRPAAPPAAVVRRPLPENPATGATPPRQPEQAAPAAPAAPVRPAGASEEVARLQVLLDRAGMSPGVIDGHRGANVEKALAALAEMVGEPLDATDQARIGLMLADTGGPAFTTYTITAEDAAGPYVASVPADYGDKARLDRLSFTSVAEMLAERFHMDENYLRAINPGVDFGHPGARIRVADPGRPKAGEVARIVADKGREQVRAYDSGGNLVAAYPATIGSADTPSPSGTVTVERVAFDPEYTYNPKLNFKQGNNDRVLRIPPGPNGPVGTIWIALSKPTYGIHGTPEPSRIGKTNSHGCVRLTNWDADELARMVKPGVIVQFID